MNEQKKTNYSIRRIGGYLHKVTPILDSTGKVISHAIAPLKVELRRRDVMQIIAGAAILSVSVAFTKETWTLGTELPFKNVLFLGGISILIIALHVYFNFS